MKSCRQRLLEHILVSIVVYQITLWIHVSVPVGNEHHHCGQYSIFPLTSNVGNTAQNTNKGTQHPSSDATYQKVQPTTESLLSTTRGTTFLLGIFCQRNDTKHRQLSRSTMLGESVLPQSVYSRICTLQYFHGNPCPH